jgi:hypothetical protein
VLFGSIVIILWFIVVVVVAVAVVVGGIRRRGRRLDLILPAVKHDETWEAVVDAAAAAVAAAMALALDLLGNAPIILMVRRKTNNTVRGTSRVLVRRILVVVVVVGGVRVGGTLTVVGMLYIYKLVFRFVSFSFSFRFVSFRFVSVSLVCGALYGRKTTTTRTYSTLAANNFHWYSIAIHQSTRGTNKTLCHRHYHHRRREVDNTV